jgi:hypothetical protein
MNKGFIYCIKSLNNNLIYIGSTKQTLGMRLSKHKYDSKIQTRAKPVHQMIMNNGGFDNFEIKLLKEIEYDDITLLHLYEKKIIEDYKHNNNYQLMNINK